MKSQQIEQHIEINPCIMSGKPVIRGTRIPVSLILNYLHNGHSIDELLLDYPNLTLINVEAAIASCEYRAFP